jgi:hypothetical protein
VDEYTAAKETASQLRTAFSATVDRKILRAVNKWRAEKGRRRIRAPRVLGEGKKPLTGYMRYVAHLSRPFTIMTSSNLISGANNLSPLRFMADFRSTPEAKAVLASGKQNNRPPSANVIVLGSSRWRTMSDEEKAVSFVF